MNPEEKKRDRRVIKSKKAIRNAFIGLLAQKNVNDISITDLAQAADVDRKTVYNYYSGVYAVQEEIEEECVMQLSQVLEGIGSEVSVENPFQIFDRLTDVLNRNMDLCSQLIKTDANSHIIRKIIGVVKENLIRALRRSPVRESPDLEMICDYITSGMVAAYQGWFNSSRTQSLKDFSKSVGILVISGVYGFVNS